MRTLAELMDLRGRVALLTGGSGHIGSAMSNALAELGADVVILDVNQGACDAAAARMSATYGVKSFGMGVDLAEEAQVRAVPEQIIKRLGRLDILVNCAAMVSAANLDGWAVPFLDQGTTAWRRALEVNLTAPFVLSQVCTPALKESGHGSIINVGSIYGLVGPDLRLYEGTGMGNVAAYAASKAGLLQLTRWLASVLAPAVRVNSITPGGLWRNQPEPFCERYVARTPLQRMGCEEDFKGACAYLASDLSSYVSGQNLVVDGGFTAW